MLSGIFGRCCKAKLRGITRESHSEKFGLLSSPFQNRKEPSVIPYYSITRERSISLHSYVKLSLSTYTVYGVCFEFPSI